MNFISSIWIKWLILVGLNKMHEENNIFFTNRKKYYQENFSQWLTEILVFDFSINY